jgi:hypothetical protein
MLVVGKTLQNSEKVLIVQEGRDEDLCFVMILHSFGRMEIVLSLNRLFDSIYFACDDDAATSSSCHRSR